MHYSEFLSGISFRFIQPHTPIPVALVKLLQRLERVGFSIEVANARFPRGETAAGRSVRSLCRMRKKSCFVIGAMIQRRVSEMSQEEAYVNVGVWRGFTLLAGMIGNPSKRCVGIDNFCSGGAPSVAFARRFQRSRSPNHTFHEMDFTDYFARVHRGPIGCYFYDGNHTYESQRLALELAEPFFAPGCIVFIDDTNDSRPRQATLDFIAHSSAGYDILFDQTTACDRHPTFHNGLMILRQRGGG